MQIDLGGVYSLAILSSPKTFVGNYGDTAVFAISAAGEGLTYQWQYQNGISTAWWNSGMAGSDTPSISVEFTQEREAYRYRCKVTDGSGEIRYTDGAGFLAEQPTWNFTYNSDGMRIGRADDLYEFSYIYNGSQLTQMTSYGFTLCFTYDASGKPMTVTLDGTLYYYVTNLQGDVVGILDANGNQVATYTYDAWGNFTVESYDTIASFNPLTYRGYVYDYETELYYLQSRYYDPEVGRFINADNYPSNGQGLLSSNMFIYCLNNPTIMVDQNGEYPTVMPFVTDGLEMPANAAPVYVNDVLHYYAIKYNSAGELYEYWFDSKGNLIRVRHHSNHRFPNQHDNPHDHEGGKGRKDKNTEKREPLPVDDDYQSPFKSVRKPQNDANALGVVVVAGIGVYITLKWVSAVFAAPFTGGSSLGFALLMP